MGEASSHTRCGYVAIVGKPNVGKSTLFNALLGERLSIITPKPQTTRDRLLGIRTIGSAQVLFLDTPGMLEPKYKLHEVMQNQILSAAKDADILLGVVDASDLADSFDISVQEALQNARVPVLIALNKSDKVETEQLETAARDIERAVPEGTLVRTSATDGTNLDGLMQLIEEALPEGPMLYPDDALTEHPERFFVSELVREEVFARLRREVPYSIAVRIEEFREDRPKVYIHAEIIVERESQKGIVIGSGGRTLKQIGSASRRKIEGFLDRPVFLDLRVKVLANWRKKETSLKGLGYRFS